MACSWLGTPGINEEKLAHSIGQQTLEPTVLQANETERNEVAKFVNFRVQDFDLPLSPILIPLFRIFVTASDESES
jgi:hypothetical protein